MNKLESIFKSFILDNNINIKSRFLIAVSGGADSMSCLFIASKLGIKIGAAHVNYMLREKESENETSLVESFCKENNIPLYIHYNNTKEYSRKNKLNIQSSAREIRYKFFDNLIEKLNFDYIITAHHNQDNIETFFINSFRGTGLLGLNGIPKKRNNIIRPLLSVNKKEIINYLKANNIPFCNDSSNKEIKYDRNYIRNEIYPIIETRFSKAEKGIKNTIELLEKDYKLLINLVEEKIAPFISHKDGDIIIDSDNKLSLDLWYHYFSKYNFSYSQINNLIDKKHQSGKILFNNDFTIYIDRKNWVIKKNNFKNDVTYLLKKNQSIKHPISLLCLTEKTSTIIKKDSHIAYFDINKLKFPLTLRKWKQGDYFHPFGMKGKKKISDFLIDNKVPLYKKNEVYVILSSDKIIWVIGYRISDNFKIDASTEKSYIIKVN